MIKHRPFHWHEWGHTTSNTVIQLILERRDETWLNPGWQQLESRDTCAAVEVIEEQRGVYFFQCSPFFETVLPVSGVTDWFTLIDSKD